MVCITPDVVMDNKGLCYSACKKAMLPEYYWDDAFQNVCMKSVEGRLQFDETKNVKLSTYLFSVFHNAAVDIMRELHGEASVDPEDAIFGNVTGTSHHTRACDKEDGRIVLREALNRLVRDCGEKTLELLVRYAILGEDREALAEEFQMSPNNVCVLKTRWWPELIGLGKDVVREDLERTLKISPNRLGFLKTYLNWI